MHGPVDLAHLFADINLPEAHRQSGAILMQEEVTR